MLSVRIPSKKAALQPLPFGGENPFGICLGVNSFYFTKNGKPVLPIMGEFHFSRWPAGEWKTSLAKMRAGGIQIAAAYVFWIHHEEERGKWDFSGSRDLRRFLSVCKEMEFPVLLRIGPWSHGECRNGGFPDWLVKDRKIHMRTNDPAYLDLVAEFYRQIYHQAEGYLWEDGGPILGVQIENEYGHCGGLNGAKGEAHMLRLKRIAVETGFRVPFYTATGWGGAVILEKEMLPVFGAYADAPWEQNSRQMSANKNYLFSLCRDDRNIGTDLSSQHNGLYAECEKSGYPYLMAELGGGLQVTAHRRTVVSADDTAALALCKLAGGANLLGYYMYHGGTNPDGRFSTLQESKEIGFPNDLPVKSYDFQAPIRESGELAASYRKLKVLHTMVRDFGDVLAPAFPVLPDGNPENPEDTENIRFCVRHNPETGEGFLFINNHQRLRKMKEHTDVRFRVQTPEGNVEFPPLKLPDHFYGVFPYRFRMGNAVLESTNAQPLCRLGNRWFFFTDEKPVYRFLRGSADIVTLKRTEAENAWKIGENLYITQGEMLERDGKVWIASERPMEKVVMYSPEGGPETFEVSFGTVSVGTSFQQAEETRDFVSYRIHLDGIPLEKPEDLILQIDFTGDRAELYRNGRLESDWFTTGLPWRVALRRFGFADNWEVRVYPSRPGTYFDLPVPWGCELKDVKVSSRVCEPLPIL